MFNLDAVQSALKDFGIDAWLFYDFRGSNMLARRTLNFDSDALSTRRYLYLVPASGKPTKLVHRIEQSALDHLPGDKSVYMRWQELEEGIASLLDGHKRVAMEYSPRNGNPYISMVDGGTIELVKSMGVEIVPSGNLIQMFEAVLSPEQIQSHFEAEKLTTAAFELVWDMIAERVRAGNPATETEVQAAILAHFDKNDMDPDHAPIVGVGPHSGDPHFSPAKEIDTPISEGDFVLVDLWAKFKRPGAVFSDITKTAFVGKTAPEKYDKIFQIVVSSRDAAIELVRGRFAEGREVRGYEVDDAARKVIDDAGYGEYFVHRTGHSIGGDLHGNGTHMDNLETHDDRLILKNTCFSIEPGIYMEEFGVRSEVNVIIDNDNVVHVTGGAQSEIECILA